MLSALNAQLDLIAQDDGSQTGVSGDDATRVLLLEAGGPIFCAGMDLGEMQQRAASPSPADEWREDSRIYAASLERLLKLNVPTIAVVQGGVLAGGMGLILACDFVLATHDSFFSLPEPARGITAAIVTPLLIWRIGPGNANRWLLSMERFSAADGLRVGVCHDVVPQEALAERTQRLVDSILSGSSQALGLTKEHVFACGAAPWSALLQQSMDLSARARSTEDAREGLQAFLEKRKPRWQP
jgi:methylglutaconyl-CoA hydratase